MKIHEFIWPQDRIDHIARHRVMPEEVEEVCFGQTFVRKTKSKGQNPVYYILGQTDAGRYLFCVVIQFPDGRGYPVTARPTTANEKLQYKQWRTMNKPKIPETDSIQELAYFWDTHDLTDFEDELQEVSEPVFERVPAIKIHLLPDEAEAVRQLAESRGISYPDLIQQWVREKMSGESTVD